MKTKVLCLLIFATSWSACTKYPLPESQREISFPYTDEHIQMEVVSTSLSEKIRAMHFINSQTGFVYTYEGELYKTLDGGITWVLKYSSPFQYQSYFQFLFTDQQTGYALSGTSWCPTANCEPPGGVLLKTTNAGETWIPVYQKKGQLSFASIAMNMNGELFILEKLNTGANEPKSRIIKSIDSGLHWTEVATMNVQYLKIAFHHQYGFLGGGSQASITRSTDHGITWNETQTFNNLWMYDISFADNIGYALGDQQAIYQTTDDGAHWQLIRHNQYDYAQLLALSDNRCLLLGCSGYSGGDMGIWYGGISQTIDGGSHWFDIPLREIYTISLGSFYNATDGYLLSNKLIKVHIK